MSKEKSNLDQYFSLIDVMDHLTLGEKKELRENCEFAIQQFGENWLDREESKIHPLRGFFGSTIGISELGELGNALKSLQRKDIFPEILERLASPSKFFGVYSEVLVGYWLVKSGVTFEFLKPKKKDKTPDVKISSGQRDIILEITTKDYPEDYFKAHENFRKFSTFFFNNKKNFMYHVVNHRPLLSPHHTDEILHLCGELMQKAEVSGFEELHIPKVIDVYIFRSENQERVPTKHRMFRFQMPKSDEFARVRGTIQQKAKQLNQNMPGVLLIFDQHFWPSRSIGHFASKLRHELEEKVFENRNLSALVIIIPLIETSGDDRDILKENESSISMKMYNPKTKNTKYKFVFFNKYATIPLSNEEREILKKL